MARVLVVDDDPVLRSVLGDLLELEGYKVAWAADGCEALTLVTHSHFDAIVTDLSMPVMDGLTFIRRYKAIPECASVPVIVLSAIPKPLGGVSVAAELRKPLELDYLVRTLAQLLGPG
jgi:CheY-like chemotaxis protein